MPRSIVRISDLSDIVPVFPLGGVILWVMYASTPQHLEYDKAGADLVFELRAPAQLAATLDPQAIEISLEIMPTIDTGMAYGVTRFHSPLKNSEY